MSGGQLVVLDRLGRDVKRFPLAEGVVTLGSDHSCDIRFMLDTVDPHHATVAVHANQTVVRAVCGGTQVNGRAVSVAALRHGDVISIGGRQLRWDYARPDVRRAQEPLPALHVSRRKAARARRGSGPAAARRDPALHAALEMSHRASMPANAGGKQVAIVQPQRRDTSEQIDKPAPRTPGSSKRPRPSKGELDTCADAAGAEPKRGTRGPAGGSPTKATLWIESRKASPRRPTRSPAGPAGPAGPAQPRRASAAPRKSTPLRLTVLKRAQSARKATVTKIEAPAKIDHMKQAALLLMTGHTPKSKLLGQKTPSPRSPNGKLLSPLPSGSASLRRTASLTVTPKSASPKLSPKSASPKSSGRRSASFVVKRKSSIRKSTPRGRASRGSARTATPRNQTVSLLDTSSSAPGGPRRGSARRSARAPDTSPPLPSPRKSALKNPLAKRSMRKTESIKFDLSNLENDRSQDSDVLVLGDSTRHSHSGSGDDLTLRYSDTSATSPSPSPRRALQSRSSRMLERALGSGVALAPPPAGPILQRALSGAAYSRRATTSVSLLSGAATPLAPRRSRTLSPRAVEAYSIVDLVSIDSNASGRSTSVYDSAVSDAGSLRGLSRKTRSTAEPTLLGSSTPYVKQPRRSGSRSSSASQSTRDDSAVTSDDSTRFTDTGPLSGDTTRASVKSRVSTSRTRLSSNKSRVSVNGSRLARNRSRLSSGSSKLSNESAQSTSKGSTSSRRSKKSLSTPENASIPISVNSTRISRASRSRSRINDSDLLFVELDEADDSPRSSRRVSAASKRASGAGSGGPAADETPGTGRAQDEGISTPENTHSPEEASTPVLSIQSLLDSSQSSIRSQLSRRGRRSLWRKTIGVLSGPKIRVNSKSKSLNFSAQGSRRRLSDDSYENMNISERQDDEIVTPRSAVKPVQEAVKNKHSTAKKPQSKRSIIDDLNESAVMKQLFNSPVKRKLSQSITELSRRQLLDDDAPDDTGRLSRDELLLALLAQKATPDDSLLERTEAFSPERFVSPLSSPPRVKALLRTPRARKSVRDDLTDVAGVKAVFAASPRNRLSDVRVKEVFAPSPANDLRRVSGVKALFRSQQERKSPRNSLGDVRGVKKLFTGRSPANDLRNVSGVKGTLRQSPRNDLSDVRGVKRLFRRDRKNELSDMSGVEELFNESNNSHKDSESLFDQLVGRPTVRAVYSRTFSSKRKSAQKKSTPKSKSLLASLDISLNTEEWLKENLRMLQELRKQRAQKTAEPKSKSANKSKLYATRELQKLSTETVVGSSPLLKSRVRASTVARASPAIAPTQKSTSESYSSHTLPIKKRSLADASANRSKNDSKHTILPIKKRAVVHSTPVKGRQANMTMNASELGRVSPIVADKPRHLEPDAPRSTIEKEPTELRPKSRRATKVPPSVASPKAKNPSPAKTRGKSRVSTPTKTSSTPTKEKSPAKPKRAAPAKKAVSPVAKPVSPKPVSPKSTRSRRAAPVSPKADAKNRGAKLVVAKKSPVMSPQPRASRKRKEPDTLPTPKATPKRSRAVRNNDEKVAEKPKTPKNTRAKVLKTTVAVVKPSPQLKPRATRRKANDSVAEKSKVAVEPKETRRAGKRETRQVGAKNKNIESLKKSPAPSPKKSRRQSPKEVAVAVAPKTRGRGKTAVGNDQSADVEKTQPKTRRARAANVEEAVAPKKARKTDKQESIQEQPKTVTKKTNKQEKPEPKVTRGKKIVQQESASPEPTTRSRRGAKPESTKPEVNTRKRKSDAPDERPAKVSKNTTKSVAGRGRSKKIESPKKETANVAKKAPAKQSKQTGKQAPGDVAKKTTRSKKAEVSLEVSKVAARSTRGKKNVTIEVAPEVGKRKRKPAVEPPVEARGGSRRRR